MSRYEGHAHNLHLIAGGLGVAALTSICPAPGRTRVVEAPIDPRLDAATRKAAETIRGLRVENGALRAENEALRGQVAELLDLVNALTGAGRP